jgi:hypothetical protein
MEYKSSMNNWLSCPDFTFTTLVCCKGTDWETLFLSVVSHARMFEEDRTDVVPHIQTLYDFDRHINSPYPTYRLHGITTFPSYISHLHSINDLFLIEVSILKLIDYLGTRCKEQHQVLVAEAFKKFREGNHSRMLIDVFPEDDIVGREILAERINAAWDLLHESLVGMNAVLDIVCSLYSLLHDSCEVHYRIIQSMLSNSQESRDVTIHCANMYNKSESFRKQLKLTPIVNYLLLGME